MKRMLIISVLLVPFAAKAQFYVNPETIHQAGDIYLQDTDVYYCPYAPPAATDTRELLSNQSDIYRDPDGVGHPFRDYHPVTRDTELWLSHPCSDASHSLKFLPWQRFFTARDKPDHTHSNIIVGSNVDPRDSAHRLAPVTEVRVCKNEDVDFRASGSIDMRAGFHVMPGAFFHAYIEPRWDTIVFSDDFSDSVLDGSKWFRTSDHIAYSISNQGIVDDNMTIANDPDATDGMALDIELREDTATTLSGVLDNHLDTCSGAITPATHKFAFSSAMLRSCPWPNAAHIAPLTVTHAHAPYGKYEYRDKIPHVLHHTNSWGMGYWEWDLSETPNAVMGEMHPNICHSRWYGPFKGVFLKRTHDTVFVSSAPKWCSTNNPKVLFFDRFVYGVESFGTGHFTDTVREDGTTKAERGGFPSYLVNRTDSVSFYYDRWNGNVTAAVPWHVDTDAAGERRVLSMPYRIDGTDTFRFSRDYQPTSVTLRVIDSVVGDTVTKHFGCRWKYSLNVPDKGLVLLDNGLDSLDQHVGVGTISYTINEGSAYPIAPVLMDAYDTAGASDSLVSLYANTPYEYHTFGMEVLPNEIRILYDSNVVRRIPDRLVPPGNPYYDYASHYARSGLGLYPAEFDIDLDKNDTLGINPTSLTYKERRYFEAHVADCSGCWPDRNGHPSAHHLLDYVKVWDIPRDMKIGDFKQ